MRTTLQEIKLNEHTNREIAGFIGDVTVEVATKIANKSNKKQLFSNCEVKPHRATSVLWWVTTLEAVVL